MSLFPRRKPAPLRTAGPYLMVGGHRIPVTGIELRGGRFVILASIAGPLPAMTEPGWATLFGDDDRGIAPLGDCPGWPEIRLGSMLNLRQELIVSSVSQTAEAP